MTPATRTVKVRGREVSLASLARKHGLPLRTLKSRLERGMSLREALTAPRRRYPAGVRRQRDSHYSTAAFACSAE